MSFFVSLSLLFVVDTSATISHADYVADQWQVYYDEFVKDRQHFNTLHFPQDVYEQTLIIEEYCQDTEELSVELSWIVNLYAQFPHDLEMIDESILRLINVLVNITCSE